MTLLPDINLWLALVFERHFHHRAANAWFLEQEIGSCHFCRITQQGLLRLASNPRVFADEAVTLHGAWQLYDSLLSDERIRFAPESPGLEPHWRSHAQGRTFSPHVWSDAYLVAFARAASLTVVTFDRGLSSYAGVECQVLS